jgi:hypothetical protein
MSRMLLSEYGAKGQGSTSPEALTWMKPLPEDRQPPKAFSLPGNPM